MMLAIGGHGRESQYWGKISTSLAIQFIRRPRPDSNWHDVKKTAHTELKFVRGLLEPVLGVT